MLEQQCELLRSLFSRRCSSRRGEMHRVLQLQAAAQAGKGKRGPASRAPGPRHHAKSTQSHGRDFLPLIPTLHPHGARRSSLDAALRSAHLALKGVGPSAAVQVLESIADSAVARGSRAGLIRHSSSQRFRSVSAGAVHAPQLDPSSDGQRNRSCNASSDATNAAACLGPSASNLTQLPIQVAGSSAPLRLQVSCDGSEVSLLPVDEKSARNNDTCGSLSSHKSLFPPLDGGPLSRSPEAPVAVWHSTTSLCMRGEPPGPRMGMQAVHLRWPRVALLFGGQIELGGPESSNMIVSGLPRLRHGTANDTFLLAGLSFEEARDAGMGPYACDVEESVEVQKSRLLPDGV